jgi:hypothetical protein
MRKEQANSNISPLKIFGALILLNLLLAAVVVIFPSGKINLGSFTLDFVPLKKIFEKDNVVVVDAKKVIENVETVDTNLVVLDKLTLEKIKKEKIDVPENKRIQYPDATRNSMAAFFKALAELEMQSNHIRIIHYGDSQLEGDRISDYLRNRLQLRFGGWGPGIILPYDISNSRISVRQSESNNWVKYAIYGKTPKLANGYYGIGASAYKYSSGAVNKGDDKKELVKHYYKKNIENPDGSVSMEIDSTKFYYDSITSKTNPNKLFGGAWMKIQNATGSYPRVRQYNRLTLLYSSEEPFNFKLKVTDGTEMNEFLSASPATTKSYNLGEVTSGVTLNFTGKSPYLYGVALDGNTGIAVDNFPMRGSSALGFDGINISMLSELYKQMNVKLIVLQYGINLVPDPKSNYDWYARAFSKQLANIKAASPNASILIIGPSDMSRKTAEGYESYPNIPIIRDAMKKAAFENGCAFWDLYTAMGGQNSMSSWVSNKLAAKDFTHFSTEGARYVSEMLYNTLMDEYQEYLKEIGAM